MTCGRVVIISRGKVVAEDTPDNLTHRLKGAATLRLDVRGPSGPVFDTIRLVRGVRAVRPRSETEGVSSFEVEVEPGQDIRPELARAVVQKGLDLLSLRELGMSLEEIFLHLTTTDAAEEPQAHALQGEVTA